ncbi:efflux RND transporter periplasmic adaptor subunit [Methylocapsa palsarum]|nr:efflux RND transporter periplasmic adaptor subunit [Methylocapsa palsarum]
MIEIAAKPRRGVIAAAGALPMLVMLAACGDRNTYQPPPPPDVTIVTPEQRSVTLFIELTGATAAVNKVDLVARVQGFIEKVGYNDGARVAKGDLLFQIQPYDYKIALDIARAAQDQQAALLVQADADLKRKQELVARQASSVASLDEAKAKRDSTFAALAQAKGQVAQASRNLDYTTIAAPFDGAVSARLADPGAFVGANGPTKLATIVQTDPIYVYFNIDEQQVLKIRQRLKSMGLSLKDLGPIPVGIGLQTEDGYPHEGAINYVAPQIDSSTGTLTVRAVLDNKNTRLLPGLFVRVRVPVERNAEALLAPEVALSTGQQGRYLLVLNDKNIVEQRVVVVGEQVDPGLRIIESGLRAGERIVVGGLELAVPGNKVHPVQGGASPPPGAP